VSQDDFTSQSHVLVPGGSRQARLTRLWLTWLVALLAVGMTVSVSIAADDPDWGGSEPENISNSPVNRAWQSVIAGDPEGRMVVAWSDQSVEGAHRNIYIRRSDDNGHTWSVPEVISETARESALPDVCIVGGRSFVTWVDQLTVGGQNVAIYEAEVGASSVRRIPSATTLSSTRPRLAAGSDELYVVFNAGANILYAARPLAATAWPTAMAIYTSTAALGPWFPMLALGSDEETLHVVWQEIDFGQWAIRYMRGKLNGAQVDWEPAHTLALRAAEMFYPAIAADSSGDLHVVWGETVGTGGLEQRDQYVRYTRYDAGTGQWGTPAVWVDDEPVRVNRDNPTYTAPGLALLERDSQVQVCVTWHGFREGDAEDVLLSCSRDGGQSWSSPQNVSHNSDTGAVSIAPSITFDGAGQVHSVWQEHSAAMGDSVIYDCQVYHSYALSKTFLPFIVRN
jgi:hypothetical protein